MAQDLIPVGLSFGVKSLDFYLASWIVLIYYLPMEVIEASFNSFAPLALECGPLSLVLMAFHLFSCGAPGYW